MNLPGCLFMPLYLFNKLAPSLMHQGMEKYPLSLIQNTLIEWKYSKKYMHELKTYEIKDKQTGDLDILFNNKIKIVNNGGTFEVRIDPLKFHLTTAAMASPDNEEENERLKNFLRNFDNEVYIKAEAGESNTEQRARFFEK